MTRSANIACVVVVVAMVAAAIAGVLASGMVGAVISRLEVIR